MKILKTINEIRSLSDVIRIKDVTIGFVPTMGALHEGHLALVERCKNENNICIVSIFVNPIQFNNPEDFAKYPRNPELDAKMLESAGCDILFEPTTEEMYPVPDKSEYTFDGLELLMEGKFRPGHFNGVAIVVKKLFEIVRPDKAYFGEKDFQQLLIVERLTRICNFPIAIVRCPIVREPDGLAMSSRNRRLNETERAIASSIPQIMNQTRAMAADHDPAEIMEWVAETCRKHQGLDLEYFEIADAATLQTMAQWSPGTQAMGFIAAFVGPVRLIDNIKYY